MTSTIIFLVVRRVLGLIGLGPKPDDKDVEIAVLRHQLAVLHRQVAPPRYARTDRLILATLARLLPRERWSAFLVTLATLVALARGLVRRRWTYPHKPRVHRGLDPALVKLVLRLARETPLGCRRVSPSRCSTFRPESPAASRYGLASTCLFEPAMRLDTVQGGRLTSISGGFR